MESPLEMISPRSSPAYSAICEAQLSIGFLIAKRVQTIGGVRVSQTDWGRHPDQLFGTDRHCTKVQLLLLRPECKVRRARGKSTIVRA
jgi:hypothetical protein